MVSNENDEADVMLVEDDPDSRTDLVETPATPRIQGGCIRQRRRGAGSLGAILAATPHCYGHTNARDGRFQISFSTAAGLGAGENPGDCRYRIRAPRCGEPFRPEGAQEAA